MKVLAWFRAHRERQARRAAERDARAYEKGGRCCDVMCPIVVEPHRGIRRNGDIFCSFEHADSAERDRIDW